jgi:two-component system, chemotaxis family, chemotaxis protein CheY
MIPSNVTPLPSDLPTATAPNGEVAPPALIEPTAATRSSAELLRDTLQCLLLLVPGQAAASELRGNHVALVLKLAPEVIETVRPILQSLARYEDSRPPHVARYRILLVDDDIVSRVVMRRVLQRIPDCEVIEATSGRNALEILSRSAVPDLCISDLNMDDVDGLSLLKDVRSTPRLRDLPVLVCSGHCQREVIEKVGALHVAGYILKPYNAGAVVTQVTESLEREESRRTQQILELRERVGGADVSTCAELIQRLAEKVTQTVTSVRESILKANWRAAANTVDGLRTASSLVAEQPITKLCESITASIASSNLLEVLEGLELLGRESERVKAWAEVLDQAARSQNEAPEFKAILDQLRAAAA